MPSPGRSSCEIRVSPEPHRLTRVLPITPVRRPPSATRRPIDHDHADPDPSTPTDPPDRRPPEPHHRHGLSELRPGPAARAGLRLSGLFRAARGDLRPRGRRRDLHSRGDRRARAGDLALPGAAAGRRAPRPGRCRSARRRCCGRSARPRPSASSGCGSRTTPATRRCRSRIGRSRSPRPGRSSSASRPSPAPRPATWPAPRPRRRPRSGCRPTCSSRPTWSPPRSTTRWPTARRSCPSTAPTTTSIGCAWRSPTRPAGGSSTSTSARSTPRAPRRSPTRSPSRSAGAPRRRRGAGRVGAMFTRVARGFEELAELGLIERRPIRFVGGQAAGCAPGGDRVRSRHRRHRAGPRARHDRPLAGHRQPGRRALRRRAGPGQRRLDRGHRRRRHGGSASATSPGSRGSTRRRPAA